MVKNADKRISFACICIQVNLLTPTSSVAERHREIGIASYYFGTDPTIAAIISSNKCTCWPKSCHQLWIRMKWAEYTTCVFRFIFFWSWLATRHFAGKQTVRDLYGSHLDVSPMSFRAQNGSETSSEPIWCDSYIMNITECLICYMFSIRKWL